MEIDDEAAGSDLYVLSVPNATSAVEADEQYLRVPGAILDSVNDASAEERQGVGDVENKQPAEDMRETTAAAAAARLA